MDDRAFGAPEPAVTGHTTLDLREQPPASAAPASTGEDQIRAVVSQVLREDLALSRMIVELARDHLKSALQENLAADAQIRAAIEDEAIAVVRKMIEQDVVSTVGDFVAKALRHTDLHERVRVAVLDEISGDDRFIGVLGSQVLASLREQLEQDAAIQALAATHPGAPAAEERPTKRRFRTGRLVALFAWGTLLGAGLGYLLAQSL